jgi:hypothetical protein
MGIVKAFEQYTQDQERIQLYKDIVSTTSDRSKIKKYKALLLDMGYDYDAEVKDDEYLNNPSLDDIKVLSDFESFDKYKRYASKMYSIRTKSIKQPKEPDIVIGIDDIAAQITKLGITIKVNNNYDRYNYAAASRGIITLPQRFGIATLIHELGHIIHYETGYVGIASEASHSSSFYGLGDAGEVFAENIKHYYINPDYLKRVSPKVYNEIKRLVPVKYDKAIRIIIDRYLGSFLPSINEALTDIVYHFTSLENAYKILVTDKMKASRARDDHSGRDQQLGGKYSHYISFATSRNLKSGYAYSSMSEAYMATIVFDGRLLSNLGNGHHVEYWPYGASHFEYEDRLFLHKSEIPNISKYIREVHLFGNWKGFPYDQESNHLLYEICQQKGIPCYFYDNREHISNLRKDKALDINFGLNKDKIKYKA